MRRRLHPLIAAFFALLLLGAQQAAFAHLIGHLGSSDPAAVQFAQPDDEGHGEALSLSHTCTTCAGFGVLDAAAPFTVPPPLTFGAATMAVWPVPAKAAGTTAPHPYLARAPPDIL